MTFLEVFRACLLAAETKRADHFLVSVLLVSIMADITGVLLLAALVGRDKIAHEMPTGDAVIPLLVPLEVLFLNPECFVKRNLRARWELLAFARVHLRLRETLEPKSLAVCAEF